MLFHPDANYVKKRACGLQNEPKKIKYEKEQRQQQPPAQQIAKRSHIAHVGGQTVCVCVFFFISLMFANILKSKQRVNL